MTIVNNNWHWSLLKHNLIKEKSGIQYYMLIEPSEQVKKKKVIN